MATADAKIRIVAEDKTAAAFKKLDSRLDRTTKAFRKFAIGVGAVVGAAGLGRLVGGTLNAADQIEKLSTRLGVGSRALSEYKHVADLSGVSFETLTMGMQRMTRRIAEAANGMGEARGALKELGLDAEKLNALPLDQKFEIIAEKLAGLGSESDRVRLAMKLFDSEGVALIQTMEGGAAGIAEMREEARKLGLSLGEDQVKAAADAKDAMTRLKAVFAGVVNLIVLKLAPPLTALLTWLGQKLPAFMDKAVSAWNQFKEVVGRVIRTIMINWRRAQITLNKGVLAMINVLKKAVDALSEFSKALGIDINLINKAQKATDEWVESLEQENRVLQAEIDVLDELNRTVVVTERRIEDAIDPTIEWGEAITDLGDASADAAIELETNFKTMKEIAQGFVDGVRDSWTVMWEGLFSGRGIDSVKDFLDTVKGLFLKTLAQIAAKWTWEAIMGPITGNVAGSIGGGSGGGMGSTIVNSVIGKIGEKILGSIGSSVFGSGTVSGGVLAPTVGSAINPAFSSTSGATAFGNTMTGGGGMTSMITSSVTKAIGSIFGGGTASSLGGATAASAGTAAAGAGMSALGFALPLAILGFGLFRSNKIKKMMKKKYRELMSDPSITANLADHALFEHIQVLGEQAGQTWVQIGDTAARVLDEVTTRSMGVMKLGYREMRDEFGNVLVTAGDFSKLMDTLERQKPFLKQADDLVKLHGQMGLAKESIDLINVELFEADAAFQKMGQAGIDAIMKIDTRSTAYATMMQKGFVTAVQTAQMGIGEFGNISAEVFDTIVRGVQDAEGSMKSLAEAAQLAINRGQKAASLKEAAGFQHGGSFVVGGGGGTDSQRVSFMATPGERVTVETPNHSKASGSDGGNVVRELRALRHDLASVVAKPIVGAVTRGQLAMAGGARH